jgi:hypothetical protein
MTTYKWTVTALDIPPTNVVLTGSDFSRKFSDEISDALHDYAVDAGFEPSAIAWSIHAQIDQQKDAIEETE